MRLLLAAMLAGCGVRSTLLLPDTDAASVVVVFDDGDLRAEARDLPLRRAFEHDASEATSVSVLLYDFDLERLRLPQGALDVDAFGDLLPRPDQIHVAEVSAEGDTSALTEVTEIPPRVAGARVVRVPYGQCPEPEAKIIASPSTEERPLVLLQLDDELALLGDESGGFYLVSPDGAERLDDSLFDGYRSGWTAVNGRMFLAGRNERLVELTHRGGADFAMTSIVSPTSARRTISWLDGEIVDGDLELFGVTTRGHLGRFTSTATAWKFVGDAAGDFSWDRQIVWAGPGEAISNDGGGDVHRVRAGGEVTVIEEPLGVNGLEAKSMLLHSTHGPLTGASDAAFAHILGGPDWEVFQSSVTFGSINVMAEAPDGEVLWASSNGFVGMVINEERACEGPRWESDSIERLHLSGRSRTAVAATNHPTQIYFLSW